MSKTPQYWCDLAPEPNTVPAVELGVRIGYQGSEWEVDLSEEAFKEVENLMEAVRSRGRPVTSATPRVPPGLTAHQLRMMRTEHGRRVRDWARSTDWPDIGDTGSIPWDVIDAYNETHRNDVYER